MSFQRNEPSLFAAQEWRLPDWVYFGPGARFSRYLARRGDIIRQCEADGISQVAPICASFGLAPKEVRERIGKGLWRCVHHSELRHNVLRAVLKVSTKLDFPSIMAIPTGALREVRGMVAASGAEAVRGAIPFATTRDTMREAVMLCRDLEYMGGAINPKWSMRRLHEEHDRLSMERAIRNASATPFVEPWTDEIDGFRFTRLISEADFAAEGRAMHHCIAAYVARAKRGTEVALRIEGRERATVSFSATGHVELRGPCNRAVSAACRKAVDQIDVDFGKEKA